MIRWFREHLDCPIHDHYGQTEVGMALCNHHGLSHDNHPGSAGLPVPGFRLAVVDKEGADVSPGAPGILAVDCKSSPLFWFQGYWQQEPRFIGEPTSELVEELQRVVKTRLAAHAYPREIEFIEQLPKTPSGKLQLHPAPAGNRQSARRNPTLSCIVLSSPRSALQMDTSKITWLEAPSPDSLLSGASGRR